MPRIAFIVANAQGAPSSPSATAAAQGFSHFGYEISLVTREALKTAPLSAETVVVGGVDTVLDALARLGIAPQHITLPVPLRGFACRRVWESTVGEVLESSDFPVFVKPLLDNKTFTGQVVTSPDALEALILSRPNQPTLPSDFPLLCQEPVHFLSEWRCFVIRGAVVGTFHYRGHPLTFPDPATITACLSAYPDAPAGYSADFGVLESGQTALVELNDGYALGHGGLIGSAYAELLRARWEELTHAKNAFIP
ncbi:ATP-grasp domain-containing protein [Armatimonas rosea]|uniref:ATP-grasp domain-containing protein n=1 Tax=Armatimonas rosea TaxID=685828 RepID=A0A7W9SV34_ARMRO|nr:hypothetical protein [Armatimonas rosea]